MRLLYVTQGIAASMAKKTGARRAAFNTLAAKLDALSPLAVMARGYSIASREGEVLTRASALSSGDRIALQFGDGVANCEVVDTILK